MENFKSKLKKILKYSAVVYGILNLILTIFLKTQVNRIDEFLLLFFSANLLLILSIFVLILALIITIAWLPPVWIFLTWYFFEYKKYRK